MSTEKVLVVVTVFEAFLLQVANFYVAQTHHWLLTVLLMDIRCRQMQSL
ncbi:hypothetical protein GBAR_LOCUS6738 [Geodia barretti]|uniref:Uncharacterized protein n=1 Tax=Geodia barretti TaxID=519541 RepID=A0AA35REW6_GEOBA|nr:hypothetical protein GBAR_LOCUS6738 [Geodia barretti]